MTPLPNREIEHREPRHLVSSPDLSVEFTVTLEPHLTHLPNSVCDLQEKFRSAIFQFDKV